jgi:hypothetical protein
MNLRIYIHFVVLLLLGTFIAIADDEPAEEVALVTSVTGNASLISGSEEGALELGARLRVGDEIRVDEGSVSVVFLAGDFVSLEAGERLVLGGTLEESTLSEGGSTRGLNPNDGMTLAADGVDSGPNDGVWQSQLASVSGIRADVTVIAVAPRLAVSDPSPVFFWYDADSSAAGAVKQYTLLLRDAEGKTIARQAVTGNGSTLNSFRFATPPVGFKAEARWHYTWTVIPEGVTDPVGALDAGFVYVDGAGLEGSQQHRTRLDSLQKAGSIDKSSYHMLMSRYYLDERERLFSDAIPHLTALAALPTGEQYARSQLARIFLRFGNQVSTLAPRILESTVKFGAR